MLRMSMYQFLYTWVYAYYFKAYGFLSPITKDQGCVWCFQWSHSPKLSVAFDVANTNVIPLKDKHMALCVGLQATVIINS